MEHPTLSQITPQELNPAMTWKESCHIDRRFDDAHAVLSCRAEKEVAR